MPNVGQLAFAAAAITGLCASATPAFAQEQEIVVSGKVKAPDGYEAVTQKVKIGDLNLASAAAVRLLDKRVGNAINALCPMPRPARLRKAGREAVPRRRLGKRQAANAQSDTKGDGQVVPLFSRNGFATRSA